MFDILKFPGNLIILELTTVGANGSETQAAGVAILLLLKAKPLECGSAAAALQGALRARILSKLFVIWRDVLA
jgi:hypothetical protein